MNYLVKNRTTGEQIFCKKVEVDGLEYYINSCLPIFENDYFYYNGVINKTTNEQKDFIINQFDREKYSKVIATNNKSINLPQVVDELNISQYSREEHKKNHPLVQEMGFALGIMVGYDKAKEMYQFTRNDMIEFVAFSRNYSEKKDIGVSDNNLLDIWENKRTKIIIVE